MYIYHEWFLAGSESSTAGRWYTTISSCDRAQWRSDKVGTVPSLRRFAAKTYSTWCFLLTHEDNARQHNFMYLTG